MGLAGYSQKNGPLLSLKCSRPCAQVLQTDKYTHVVDTVH